MRKGLDKHHLCFPRKDWNKGYAHAIRGHWYFVVEIPKDTLHPEIHHTVPSVPVPRGSSAKDAYEQVVMLESYGVLHKTDPIEKRLRLLVALFDCADQPTADAFKEQLKVITNFKKPSC